MWKYNERFIYCAVFDDESGIYALGYRLAIDQLSDCRPMRKKHYCAPRVGEVTKLLLLDIYIYIVYLASPPL